MSEKEEADILETYESGEWQSIGRLQEEIARYQAYAQDTLVDKGMITVQLSPEDLQSLQQKAKEAGISYQALVAHVLRQFANDRLMEKPIT